MNMKLKILGLACLALLMIQCQKEAMLTPSGPAAPVRISSDYNMLVFADQASFDSTMKVLFSYESKDLHLWEESMNFHSMRAFYNPIPEDLGDTLLAPLTEMAPQPVEDHWLAAILTPEGFMGIADTVYLFTRDTTYSYVDNQEVKAFPIKRYLITRPADPGLISCDDVADYEYNVKMSTVKTTLNAGILKTHSWAIRFSFFYSSTGVTVVHYKETPYYFQGTWSTYLKETPADFLGLEWNICSIEGYWGFPKSHVGSMQKWGHSTISKVVRTVVFADVGIKGIYKSEYNNSSYSDNVITPQYYGI
ncbi:MAG: hypothetical protein WD077_06950 [Bacteroidia bacterium]